MCSLCGKCCVPLGSDWPSLAAVLKEITSRKWGYTSGGCQSARTVFPGKRFLEQVEGPTFRVMSGTHGLGLREWF
jgi:hypothetical protein